MWVIGRFELDLAFSCNFHFKPHYTNIEEASGQTIGLMVIGIEDYGPSAGL